MARRRTKRVTLSEIAKSGLRALSSTHLKFIIPLVVFLVLAVFWVFGTLPWLVINFFLCFPEEGVACSDAEAYARSARLILSVDIIVILLSGFAVFQIKRLRRSRQ
ncbi:MAG: hypothetical protein ACFE0J_13920 [Elainellaceae cyanobacterium]